MRTLKICSHAKLNLTFEILDNLPDGYHSVRTLFQSIDLGDILTFKLEDSPTHDFHVELQEEPQPGLTVASEHATFPLGDDNLIVKAAKRFEKTSECGAGKKLTVLVQKNIPIAAGMAGGSGNAAATIRAMQEFFPDRCFEATGQQVASKLGSDINFCLNGGTQIGTSRGEILQPVSSDLQMHFLIIKPREIAISTPWIFRQYDQSQKNSNEFDSIFNYTELCRMALLDGSPLKLSRTFFNAFEKICFEKYPEVERLKDLMLSAGCLSANITGSGPTLFGLLPSTSVGPAVAEKFRKLATNLSPKIGFDLWLSSSCTTGLTVMN
jgi:4-diphosphocytidyl-2-C-methyl-D-erythritol kinase